MNRRRNYGFERKQRDALRRTRQETKRDRKAARAAEGRVGPEMGEAQDTTPPAGQCEWFSASRNRLVTMPAGQSPNEGPPDDWVLLTDNAQPDDAPAG